MKKLFKSRSATFNVLLTMIITLAAGLVLIVAGYTIAQRGGSIQDDKKCQLSFFAATQMARVSDKSKGFMDAPVSIECPRREVVIDVDSSTTRRGKIIENLVKGKIANEMMSCWSKTGAGKLDPSKEGGFLFSTDQRFCLICSEIKFSDDFKELAKEQNVAIDGLAYWTATRRVPGQEQTLYEWMTGGKITDPKVLQRLKKQDDRIEASVDLDKKYAVLWRADVYKASTWAKSWHIISGVAVLVTAVGVMIALPGAGSAIVLVAKGALAAAEGTALGFGISSAIEGSSGQAKAEVHFVPIDDLASVNPPGSEHVYCSFMMN